MNALTGYRSNSIGSLSPRPDELKAAAESIASMARARNVGMAKAAGVIPKSTDTETDVVSGDTLDRDAFLQLLVLQMQHQDPMEPTDNSQMLAQLAQFSSLEQMNNLNDNFEMLSGNVDQLNFITANSLLGRTIHGVDSEGEAVNGVVDSVYLNGSLVYLRVGEQLVSMAGVASIEEPES